MTNPYVLLLDEPTAGLSPTAAKDIFVLIRELASSGIAILMVEQNALLALSTAPAVSFSWLEGRFGTTRPARSSGTTKSGICFWARRTCGRAPGLNGNILRTVRS